MFTFLFTLFSFIWKVAGDLKIKFEFSFFRSLSSASPPTSMMNGGGIPPQSATPTPEEEKNPEYLKELQAEKDNLESAYAAAMAVVTSSEATADNTSDSEAAASKTNHAIKLLEQGKTFFLIYR
jgi:hypothetical protein